MSALKIQIARTPWQDLTGPAEFRLEPGEALAVELSSGGHWYGHGFNHDQPYPLESGTVVNPAFAVNNIQSPIWMCSAGFAILAQTTAALDVRINEGHSGCLVVRAIDAGVDLRVFAGATLPEAQSALLTHLGWPNPAPPVSVLGDCFFCTWTQYPRCITQERVLDMARQIRAHNYPCSTLIVDDRWESCFGDLAFSKDFPDPKAMIEALHGMGFRVWLWVTPFVNREAASFADLAGKRFLVPARKGKGAALLKWWGGTAGLVDLTNPEAREWFKGRLLTLQADLGVDGFKVDGGDFKYQPPPDTARWHQERGPSGYADALLDLFEEVAPHRCETRTAWLSQSRRVLWRQGGKDSHWGPDNGLRALVHLGLNLGLMGYDLLIPDMVPGRVQTLKADHPLPTDELMVRWTEVSAFMPILQFSYFPWNYAAATEAAVRGYAHLHKAMEGYIAAEARNRKAPLLRPIWYDYFAPTPALPTSDADAGVSGRRSVLTARRGRFNDALYATGDEFMLGGHILVAPVLTEGATSRDVLLPPGSWTDAWDLSAYQGGELSDHPAPCPGMPIFVRSRNKKLLDRIHAALQGIARGSVPSGTTTATHSAGLDRDLKTTG